MKRISLSQVLMKKRIMVSLLILIEASKKVIPLLILVMEKRWLLMKLDLMVVAFAILEEK